MKKSKKKASPAAKRHALFNMATAAADEERGEKPKPKIGKRPPLIPRY